MSKIKDWILEQQEIDSQDDPDMLGPDYGELHDEASSSTSKEPSGNFPARRVKPTVPDEGNQNVRPTER